MAEAGRSAAWKRLFFVGLLVGGPSHNALFFYHILTGYYDRLGAGAAGIWRLYIPAECTVVLYYVIALFGLRVRALWGYAFGFLFCGVVTYDALSGTAWMVSGTIPWDWVTVHNVALCWILGPPAAWFLYRD